MKDQNWQLDRARKDLRGSGTRVAIILLITPLYDWSRYWNSDLRYEPVAYLVPRACVVTLLAMLLGAWSERIFLSGWPKWVRGAGFALALTVVVTLSVFGVKWCDSALIGHSMRGLGVMGFAGFLVGAGFMGFKRRRDQLETDGTGCRAPAPQP